MKILVSSCFAAALFTFSLETVLAHSANEPAPRPEPGWKDRHQLLNQRATDAGAKAQVIFIGDSITQGWEGAGKEVWERSYAKRNAVNLGIGGDRTQHVLWRLDNGNLNGLKPKAAVVMIGTNNSNGEDNSVEQIADGIAAIVRKLREKLPGTKVLLLGIFPRSENPTPQRGKLLMINQIIRKLADDQNVFYMDIGHLFVDEKGLLPRSIMPDFLHLSEKGYELWAQAIEERLASMLDGAQSPLPTAAASTAAQPAAIAGTWTWTMDTPNGPVSAPLMLEVQGNTITGRFARDENRWLNIEDGKLNGKDFTWTVKRDRPDGSIVVYRMSGAIDGNKITGRAAATISGAETTIDWSALRQ